MSDLNDILAVPKEVEIKEDVVQVRTITIGELQEFGKLIGPIHNEVAARKLSGNEDIQDLVWNFPHIFIKAIEYCTDKDLDYIGKLEIDDIVILGTACIEVNNDFFVRAVIPIILTMAAKAAGIQLDLTKLQTSSKS